MIRPADDGQPEQKIPFRYDWQERGGWYIDYVMQDAAKAETSKAYATLLEAERQRCEESNSLTARKNLQLGLGLGNLGNLGLGLGNLGT